MALMHIPPPFPTIILNFFKYLQIGSVFFDDIAVLVNRRIGETIVTTSYS